MAYYFYFVNSTKNIQKVLFRVKMLLYIIRKLTKFGRTKYIRVSKDVHIKLSIRCSHATQVN